MTRLDQIKILNNKIKPNEGQYVLDRRNAEISAKSSGELDKYEYLTGEDLGYKPDSVEKAKFEYSPLGKVFTEGLVKKDEEGKEIKNVWLLQSLKDIRDINKKPFDLSKEIPDNANNNNRDGNARDGGDGGAGESDTGDYGDD